MFSTLRSSSLPFAATVLASLVMGCASSKALEVSDNARNPANVPRDDVPAYPQAPVTDETNGRHVTNQRYEASDGEETAPAERFSRPAGSQARKSAANRSGSFDSRDRGDSRPSAASIPPPREERPGLGTTWGETRSSYVREVDFVRQSSSTPASLLRIQYNDEQGLLAQLGAYNVDHFTSNYSQAPNRFVTVELVDPNGVALPGMTMGDRTYVLGSHGDRYIIRIRNHERQRFEVIATVDGLDVIDGKRGSYGKRGYILNGYDTLLIEGFRQSSEEVAAFRFGSVRDSYSAQSGKGDRNVGVIGIALFDENRPEPVYTDRELELRDTADPFPARYARPPQYRRAD